jgi:hypothetical protein
MSLSIAAQVTLFIITLTLPSHAVISPDLLSSPPVSLQHGVAKVWQDRWDRAQKIAQLEQQVEDYNAVWIAHSKSSAEACRLRRCLVLPLDDAFDPNSGTFSHGHVQTGDKISLSKNFWQAVELNKAEVPWLYKISRIEGVTGERVQLTVTCGPSTDEHVPFEELDAVVGGPLDYRAPANYVFLPWWMMRALGLRPWDIVQVEQITTVAPGSLAKLRPHSSNFGKRITNPQAVLETELRHYSSLTKGSTIALDYNNERYWLDVEECRSAPRGEKSAMIKLQDCNVAFDFLPAKETKRPKRTRSNDEY